MPETPISAARDAKPGSVELVNSNAGMSIPKRRTVEINANPLESGKELSTSRQPWVAGTNAERKVLPSR